MVDKDMNIAATVILALSKIYVILLIICLDENQPQLLHKHVTFCFDKGEFNDNVMY